MTAYVLVFASLFLLALASLHWPIYSISFGRAGTVLLVLFAGLRIETGYDWLLYERYFDYVVDLSDICAPSDDRLPLMVEPLYAIFNIIVKSIGGDLTILFLFSAAINLGIVGYVVSRISSAAPVVWLAYYGLAYLVGQFTVIRQSMGSAFVLLALYFVVTDRRFLAGTSMLAAIGFHTSTALLSPLLLLSRWRPSWRIVVPALVAFGVAAVFQVDVFGAAIRGTSPFLPEFLSSKLVFYENVVLAPLSPGAAGFIALHVLLLWVFYVLPDGAEKHDRFVTVALWLTITMLSAHLLFGGFPTLWNRFLLVALPWQVAAFYRLSTIRRLPWRKRLTILLSVGALSAGALIYTLQKPESAPFLPYHSLVDVWLFEDRGDGRERLTEQIIEAYGGETIYFEEPDMNVWLRSFCHR